MAADRTSPLGWVGEPVGHERFGLTPPGVVRTAIPLVPARLGGIGGMTRFIADSLGALSGTPGQHNLVLNLARSEHLFTQCLIDPLDGLWLEVVSNAFIPAPSLRLSAEDQEVLARMGYRPPVESLPNHWQLLDPPVDHVEAATLLVCPLVALWGLGDHDGVLMDIYPHLRQQ